MNVFTRSRRRFHHLERYDVTMNGTMRSCLSSTAQMLTKLGGHALYIMIMLLRSRAVLELASEADFSQHAAENEVLPAFHGTDRRETWWA